MDDDEAVLRPQNPWTKSLQNLPHIPEARYSQNNRFANTGQKRY